MTAVVSFQVVLYCVLANARMQEIARMARSDIPALPAFACYGMNKREARQGGVFSLKS